MEIYKNKKTDKAFIYLEETDDRRALMITPDGDVKALEYHLFSGMIEIEDNGEPLMEGKITQKQYEVYNQYNQK